ncbi:centromere protein I [Alosa sapidissima]|uniref:centromere protein I n=1 Tax=Alosa sapidissima TaxID=34773 RepID=UPI001C0A523E|nr:centromere protein I [Alosa sapidissima]
MTKSSSLSELGRATNCSDEHDSSCNVSSSNRSLRLAENAKRKSEAEAPFLVAFKYFSQVKAGTPVNGNDELLGHLDRVERMALAQGLPPDAVSIMLEFAMSLRCRSSISSRVLRFLIPASVVPQEAVVRGFSWLCTQKMPQSMQILFLRWVLTMFDMIDCKDNLRAIYGFIFSFVIDESLCPFICHLLYLLTIKGHVKPFRVRKLLDIQGRMGKQPYLMQLLALYKVFCPEMVTLTMPSRMRAGFKNHSTTWKAALAALKRRNAGKEAPSMELTLGVRKSDSRKRKFHHLEVPALTPAMESSGPNARRGVCLQQLSSFNELLDNLNSIELPAQMGSLLSSALALHYLDCVQDESAFLRLNFWLGHALHEEFLFGPADGSPESMAEASHFLSMLVSTQHFLQEGFSSTEGFLFKFLQVWDGFLHRPQILELLSDIPLVPSSYIKDALFEPLMQLYFTSSVFFKCSVIECLTSMLRKWLTWHSICAQEEGLDISLNNRSNMSLSLSGFLDSVLKLVQFVGRLTSAGLQLERGHTLLLHHALGFYETVSDMFLKYSLPLFVMLPPGVFYPALLATDPVSVDRLGYIMFRYRQNLTSAKEEQKKQKELSIHINRSVYQEFNSYLVAMVAHLWNSRSFSPRSGIQVSEALLERTKVGDHSNCFDLIHHPAFLNYAIDFHQQCWPERADIDLNSIKAGKYWEWYVEFLFTQGFDGLRDFIKVNINPTVTRHSDGRPSSGQPLSQPSQPSQPTAEASSSTALS